MKGKGYKVMVKHARLLILIGSMILSARVIRPAHAAPPSKVPVGWTAVDIGYDDPAGSTIVDEAKNEWTIEGSGSDIESSADQFHFAYEKVTGDATITAHFVSMHLDEGPIISQASFSIQPDWGLKEIVAAGQKLETKVLVKAVKLYLAKRLDVYWGTVKQV